VVEDLHRSTSKGERPESALVAGRLYDALDAAGVEVTITPFVMITAAR
jgi:hypothetical protein